MQIDPSIDLLAQANASAEIWRPAWLAWYRFVARYYPRGEGLEVGVAYGGHLAFLREHLPHARLTGVDAYAPYAVAGDAMDRSLIQWEWLQQWVTARLDHLGVILEVTSSQKYAATTNSKFDWIFLDGAHDYDSVAADIKAFTPLCKHLGGHDFGQGWPGVKRAVLEEQARRKCRLEVDQYSGVWHLLPEDWGRG